MHDDRVAATCAGKQGHERKVAKQIAEAMRKRGRSVVIYRCKVCGDWHIGAPGGKKGKGK